jgi:hypothetical protein
VSADRTSGPLFNAGGAARQLVASPLFALGPAKPGPALRRGALVAVPIAVLLIIELGFGAPTKGALATGALLAGFPGLDAPAGPRAAWQAAAAPAIGLVSALGVLSSQATVPAVLAMALLGAAAGYCFAVSLRFAIFGLSVALALVISQGLYLPTSEAGPALLYGTAGGLAQALWSLVIWIGVDRDTGQESGWSTREALAALASNFNLTSAPARHAIRFGAALAIGVAAYRILGLHDHGFWIPLTILFVMRPQRDETFHRLILRAIGTVLGLVVATAAAEALGGQNLAIAILLSISAALAYGLLTVQYALFTAAITTYVVLLAATIDEGAFHAAGQRATGTAIGILIAFLAWIAWPNPRGGAGSGVNLAAQPNARGRPRQTTGRAT